MHVFTICLQILNFQNRIIINTMLKLEEFMGKRVLESSLINDDKVTAFFTTRDLPLKYGERENLKEEIENNKNLVCEGLKIEYENLIIPQQTHSDNVNIVEHGNTSYPDTDALITNKKGIALALNFADCVPLIFYDPVKTVIAEAHAGWRGTAVQIGVKTVEKMIKEFGSNPKDIIALIGPSIGKCCFEVKDDVKNQLLETIEKAYHNQVCENNHLDLKLINKFQLLAIGLQKIDLSTDCTSCKTELFFSYRKENGHTARHSAVVMLKGEK